MRRDSKSTLGAVILLAGATSCGATQTSTHGETPPESTSHAAPRQEDHRIDEACATSPPASGLACADRSYCVRPPDGETAGAHCYCKEGRASCRPVFSHPPKGPCTTEAANEEVLVYEGGVVVGWTCMCTDAGADWICSPPPPG